ncbi:hypothetical protein [Leptospira kanakyensis]|uniref:hypothetical protein n=1 Tax=Leptospira kanakyensis TaxID=2484968 RepID=UPI00223CDEC4|nr:hypothetical protein [Leptospira kanakyensis]MCW7479641.1 hypothetical protein [Leptospira kanakyensis]
MKKQIHKIFFLIFFLPFFSNCYLNPVVNGILNPAEEENSNSTLGLLGLGSSAIIVTGQLMSIGAGVSGATVRIAGSTDVTNQSITDIAGRFKLIGTTGSMTLEVNHISTTFTIEILVTPPIVTLVSISNSSYTVMKLEAYSSSIGNPTFFDLTSSMPFEGLNVNDNTTYTGTIGSGFIFNFSENLALPSNSNAWGNENFAISPSLTFMSTSVVNKNVTISVDSGTYAMQTYTLTLLPGIISESGKSIKPTVIRFQVSYLP